MRKSQVFQARDMNRTAKNVEDERDYGYAQIVNYSGNGNAVRLRWNLNNKFCKRDQIFEIQIGDQTALVSSEEVQRYARWV